jgi:RNA polymerase sigma-70 factor (ECF subfamily)
MSRHHDHASGDCREIFSRLSEYLDGELPSELCEGLEGHLEDCPPCRAFLLSLRRTVDWIRDDEVPEMSDEMRRSLSEAWRACRGNGRG